MEIIITQHSLFSGMTERREDNPRFEIPLLQGKFGSTIETEPLTVEP